jgi:hypothetical protein
VSEREAGAEQAHAPDRQQPAGDRQRYASAYSINLDIPLMV